MICYYYPPLTDVGCKRSVAFSKYFPKLGWNPIILSVKNPDKTYCNLGNDYPPSGVKTYYTYSIINTYKILGKLNGICFKFLKLFGFTLKRNYFYDLFCIPDYFWGWIPLSILKGFYIIRKENITCIYVSVKPFSSAIIGTFLKLLTGKPLILDFRDPFSLEIPLFQEGVPKFRRSINRFNEEFTLRHADLFIVTSEETRVAYIEQYPFIKKNIFTIYNGFDSSYMSQNKVKKYHKFTIVYAGEFYLYDSDNNIFTEIFFKAISSLKSSGKINSNNFQFLFYGDGKQEINKFAVEYGVEALVLANGRIPYKDILEVLARSHLQLLRIVKLMISTKFFEGVPLNIPFLATIPKGEVEELIRKYSPSSYIITEESSEKVAAAILDAIDKYKNNNVLNNYVQNFLELFSRENVSRKFIQLLELKIER